MLKNKRIYLVPIFGFITIILISTVALLLPISNMGNLELKDALFTAVSATCANGLTTVDLSETYTFIGQVIIAMTVEIGSIGFIAVLAYILRLKHKKIALSDNILISNIMNNNDYNKFKQRLNEIIRYTLVIELVGAILLSIKFIPLYGIVKGIWFSIFHSITAFCNAGFDLFGNSSLQIFTDNTYINIVFVVLMLLGGIGFFVIEDIIDNIKNKKGIKNLQFHSKVILSAATIVFLISFIVIRILEPNLTFLQVLFTSATLRTTGFSTVDMASLNPITISFCTIFMMIGGAPGSTSGGIRLAAVSVLVLTIKSVLQGKKDVVAFYRKIDIQTIKLAITNICVNITIIIVFLAIFTRAQAIGIQNVLFTCVSAFTETGLSTINIGALLLSTKIVIMVLMFIGRVGAMSLLSVFSVRKHKKNDIDYVNGSIIL